MNPKGTILITYRDLAMALQAADAASRHAASTRRETVKTASFYKQTKRLAAREHPNHRGPVVLTQLHFYNCERGMVNLV